MQALRELYSTHASVEIIEVADVAEDDFTDALKGVDAIIHTASPLPGRADMETTLKVRILLWHFGYDLMCDGRALNRYEHLERN